MRRRLGNRKGQQIVEYLIIVAAIVAAVIFAVGGATGTGGFAGHIKTLFANSNTKVSGAATALDRQKPEGFAGS